MQEGGWTNYANCLFKFEHMICVNHFDMVITGKIKWMNELEIH